MRPIVGSARAAYAALIANPMRSLLTGLAMAIGVASVTLVISLAHGLDASVRRQFEVLGGNVLVVRGDTSYEDRLRGKVNRLSARDIEEIRLRVDGIGDVTPLVTLSGTTARTVRYGAEETTPLVFGTTASILDVQKLETASGRFLSPLDARGRAKVAVIGEKVRADLRLPHDASGRFVQIGSEWFRVIGVMEARGEMLGLQQDNQVYIPYETAIGLLGYEARPDLQAFLRVHDAAAIEKVEDLLRRTLRSLHRLKDSERDGFKVENARQMLRTVRGVLGTITAILSGIIGISILVGGIGIMNIMLVSVTERTREIGICKALGARRADILLQFLLEAAGLALAGGLVGVGCGYAAAELLAWIVPEVPGASFSWPIAALILAFSAAVGIAFGVTPASRAAALDPIVALRHE